VNDEEKAILLHEAVDDIYDQEQLNNSLCWDDLVHEAIVRVLGGSW
jgi:hypothetical protein